MAIFYLELFALDKELNYRNMKSVYYNMHFKWIRGGSLFAEQN
jgi:hypothetical protein